MPTRIANISTLRQRSRRSHRIDNEEFWGRQCFLDFEAAAAALPLWERTYNVDRFSLALHGDTPAGKLARRIPDAKIA